MALNTFKCNCLTPLDFKGLTVLHTAMLQCFIVTTDNCFITIHVLQTYRQADMGNLLHYVLAESGNNLYSVYS